MCKKIIFVLTLSLLLISSTGAATVNWNFEEGNGHNFELWCVQPAGLAIDDPTIAGDETLTGVGGASGLPDAGMAWTVGPPDQFDGLAPAIEEGCHVVNGLLVYGPCNDPFGYDGQTPNSRGQTGYLNTYNLNQWGDNLHSAANDQIATSPIVTLDENAVLTVWSHGGGSGTHAPEYDPNPDLMYSDGSSGIAVLSADEDDMYAILATIHTQGQGTLTEDTLDLSAFAGKKVFIEVVDAFQGSWGWLAIDEIQITNAISKSVAIVVQLQDDEMTGGFDQTQVDHLRRLGYDVTVVTQGDIADGNFTKDDADALDLLIISESISSSGADPLIGTTAPVMHQEAYGWDNWSFMGPAVSITWQSGTEVDIVNDTHPIIVNAGLSIGPMTFFDPQNSWTTELTSNLAPGAELLAKITVGGEDSAIVFAIEKGAELANGNPAASRTVGFSLPGLFPSDGGPFGPERMTDEAWVFYDAAIAWLVPEEAPEAPEMVDPGTEGLIASYSFEGDVLDGSGNGNDGTIMGDPGFVEGMFGQAIDLDGDGDYIDCGANPILGMLETNEVTVATWVNIRSIAHQWAAIVGKGENSWRLGNASLDPRFHFGISIWNAPDTPTLDGVTAVGFDEWHHVAGMYDGGSINIYLDGALDISTPTTEPIGATETSVLIGDNPEATGRYWDGLIDELLIYNRALSENEILFLAQ